MRIPGFILAVLVLPSLCAAAAPEFDADRLTAYLESACKEMRIPGVAVGVITNGEVAYLRGFGHTGRGDARVTAQTPFYLGSISKSFTAVAVTQLAEEGRIDLDEPVRRYLPWFALADEEASKRLTLRHLLHHESGITQRAVVEEEDPEASIEDRVRALRDFRPAFAPGTGYAYANLNYIILGLIVERAADTPFPEYLRGRILKPLGMTNSFTSHARAEEAGLTSGHLVWFGYPSAREIAYPEGNLPSGTIMASAEDMTRYLLFHLGLHQGEPPILSEAGIRRLHEPLPEGMYARGWMRGRLNGVPAVYHGGTLATFNTFTAFDPDRQWACVILLNVDSHFGGPYLRAMQKDLVSLVTGNNPQVRPEAFRAAHRRANAAMLCATVLLGVAAWRTARRCRRGAHARPPRRAVALLELLLPLSLLAAIPAWLGLSWRRLFFVVPDLTAFALLALVLAALLGAARLWVGRRR